MGIQPEGEDLRNAVKWISEERLTDPAQSAADLAAKAAIRFNLSPKDSEFLLRLVTEEKSAPGK